MPGSLLLRNRLNSSERAQLDSEGYVILPGLLTAEACTSLTTSLQRIAHRVDGDTKGSGQAIYGHYAAEHDSYLASLIGHPQMLGLAQSALGPNLRYDHCVALNRKPGFSGLRWHSHPYSDGDPNLRFLRIFFYVNGFTSEDSALQVVPGSHHFRDSLPERLTDQELQAQWLPGKVHPATGKPLRIERLRAAERSVVLTWTHLFHGVTANTRQHGTRWTVVYGYRNPGEPSPSRWISESFEHSAPADAKGLMSLY